MQRTLVHIDELNVHITAIAIDWRSVQVQVHIAFSTQQ